MYVSLLGHCLGFLRGWRSWSISVYSGRPRRCLRMVKRTVNLFYSILFSLCPQPSSSFPHTHHSFSFLSSLFPLTHFPRPFPYKTPLLDHLSSPFLVCPSASSPPLSPPSHPSTNRPLSTHVPSNSSVVVLLF